MAVIFSAPIDLFSGSMYTRGALDVWPNLTNKGTSKC
jgi:hypothetical protein